MRRSTLLFVLFFCAAQVASADSLRMKNGETREGKILVSTDSHVLFRRESDGLVSEVPRSEISILDGDPSTNPIKQSSDGVFSQSPKAVKSEAGKTSSLSDSWKKVVDGFNKVKQMIGQGPDTSSPADPAKSWINPNLDVLEKARSAVKLSNDRTHEAEERMEQMKKMLEQT